MKEPTFIGIDLARPGSDQTVKTFVSPPEFIWLDPDDFGLLTEPMYKLLTARERRGLVKYRKVNGR
jgi:hypothetical protein